MKSPGNLSSMKPIKFSKYLFISPCALLVSNLLGSNICLAADFARLSAHDNKIIIDEKVQQRSLILEISQFAKEAFEKFVNNETRELEIYSQPDVVAKIMGEKLEELLSDEIKQILKSMGKTGRPNIVHLKNLPIDSEIPSEGTILERVNKKGKVSESFMLGIAYVMGCEARANHNEQEGRIIHNIAPVKEFENTMSSRGKDPFYLHTENAYEETPPDFLMLYSLVGDPDVFTTYYFVEDFINLFPETVLREMEKKQFNISAVKGYLDSKGSYALLTKEACSPHKLRLRLYQNMERVTPLSEEVSPQVEMVLDHIKKILGPIDPNGISLNPGEALIFNNAWGLDKADGIMHGRKGNMTNLSRWLQRAFLFKSNS